MMSEASKIFPDLKRNFQLNYVRKYDRSDYSAPSRGFEERDERKMISALHSYLWVEDSRVYCSLLGYKPDGSDNVEIEFVDDEEDDFKLGETPVDNGKSWAESGGKMVTIPQPKILDIYHEPQDNFEIRRAGVNTDEKMKASYPGIQMNVLFVANLEPWVDEEIIKRNFVRYSSVGNKWPMISIFMHPSPSLGRSATITFDPRTNDARFALVMNKKIRFVSKKMQMTKELLVNNYVRKPKPTGN